MNTSKDAAHAPKALSIHELIENHYQIPLYQRAYAWGEAEINTLLRDIRDARLNSDKNSRHETSDYYIGSLVVNNALEDHDQPSEVVDGQQRLTTIFIILALYSYGLSVDINKYGDKLSGFITFAGRPESQDDIQSLARGGSGAINRLSTDSIRHAAVLVEAALQRGKTADSTWSEDLLGEPIFSMADVNYLLGNVKILQTELPPHTDLTHYFEIMNTRGEQLEKHEVLKSRLLSKLKTSDHVTFSIIWDACSVLDRHIQSQFSPHVEQDVSDVESERTAVFGNNWDAFNHEDGEQLFKAIQSSHKGDTGTPLRKEKSLQAVLEDQSSSTDTKPTEPDPGRYNSIIDFPNLLLHILKLQQGEKHSWSPSVKASRPSPEKAVRLEDKYLLSEFERTGPKDDSGVRDFAFLLLKTRFLMDTYVIRSQPGVAGDDIENWVIDHAHKEFSKKKPLIGTKPTFGEKEQEPGESSGKEGRRVLMLQTMFQVTDTRRASKHFLFHILEWLHNQDPSSTVEARPFADFLESSMNKRLRALNFKEVCNKGVSVPNFLFNALDYHLWRLGEYMPEAATNTPNELRTSALHFRFRYRTSVEHFYPVSPSKLEGHEQLPEEHSNHFGNLCLMSRSENSRRNNLMPESKVKEFRSTSQSLKFQLMAAVTERPGGSGWNINEIQEHGDEMLKILEDAVGRLSDDRTGLHK